jgi:hypothetical protein
MAKKRMKLIEDDGFIPGNSDGIIDWDDEEFELEKEQLEKKKRSRRKKK